MEKDACAAPKKGGRKDIGQKVLKNCKKIQDCKSFAFSD